MKNILPLLIFFFATSSVFAQKLYIRNDSIPITQDSLVLEVGKHRGNVFWQQSFDKIKWITYNNQESDTLITNKKIDAFYRAKIVEGNCNPIYSDTIRVSTNDSIKIISANTSIVAAYPETKGEIVQFKVKNDTLICEKINNEYLFQGDIVLSDEQVIRLTENKGAIISDLIKVWPEGKVYYSISKDFIGAKRITDAIKHWTEKTNLKFIERVGQNNYIEFINDPDVCCSNVGMIGSRQYIKFADWGDTGSAIHEIGHAIGLLHEQSRSDRDQYITIHFDNIIKDKQYNFDLIANSINTDYFDFISIMLYPCYNSFAIDPLKPVITKKDNSLYNAQTSSLSKGDIEIVKKLYPQLEPTVTTNEPTNIASSSATCGGNVTDAGGTSITSRGVCWSTAENPTTSNNKSNDGTGTGSFTSNLSGLVANTTYYVKAYAINSEGSGYGDQVIFKTPILVASPIVGSELVTNITKTTATSGGWIDWDGGTPITALGVCWSTSMDPTIDNNKTTDDITKINFTSNLTGLTANTKYFVRAYATNSLGTGYGNNVGFTTSQTITNKPTLTTNPITAITQTTATSGGNVNSDGGTTVTSRGVCWSTTTNPTTTNSKTTDGTGTGNFTSNLTGLTANTTYYVRAYATNSAGTAYGDQVSFTTTATAIETGTVTDIDGNVYHTVTIGTQVWMVENLKTTKYNDGTSIPNVTDGTEWTNLNTPGYCWYNNDASYKNPYGALYNWYSVNTGKLAPTGWHVPSDTEWTILTTFLGGEDVAGGKLKESGYTHWQSPNTGATNETGFTALPAGYRFIDGTFYYIGDYGNWWSSTEYCANDAWYRGLYSYYSYVYRYDYGYSKEFGFSVRCVRD